MNTTRHTTRRHRWLVAFLAGALLGGGLWAAAGSKDESTVNPPAVVKLDERPLPRSEGGELSFAPIVKRVTPSVVKVVTFEQAKELGQPNVGGLPFDEEFLRRFFGQGLPNQGQRRAYQEPRVGLGSGVIVTADGYILTNNHVVDEADKVKVTLDDGRELTAKVIGKDSKTDIAVIKVEAKDLPSITIADSDKVEVGDRVLAVGNPFGLGQTVTTGIVSAMGRVGAAGLAYEDFIQTDAAINPGNSGGALVDMQGRLIGINTAILSRTGGFQGIGFAIPSSLARQIMDSLVTYGKITRGYLGVGIQDLTSDIAEQFDLPADTKGILVTTVEPDGPAAEAGVESDDVIIKFNGKETVDRDRLRFAVAATRPGTSAELVVLHKGKEKTLTIKVGTLPGDDAVADAGSANGDEGVLNGVGVSDITPAIRREFNIPARVKGAVVTEVDPMSASAEAGLSPGDVIQEINRQPVTSAQEAVDLTATKGDGKTLLKVWSRGGMHYLVVDESEPVESSGR